MLTIGIECPTCRVLSVHAVESLASVCLFKIHGDFDAQKVLDALERSKRLFECKAGGCWAPCQAVVCATADVADQLRRLLSRITWSSPRRVPVLLDGTLAQSHQAVVFNHRPLNRWREIRISELVKLDLIAKFLAFYSKNHGRPVTFFEAWPVRAKKGKIFWIPVQPTGSQSGSVALGYRKTCTECRGAFEAGALALMSREGRHCEDCRYCGECPASRYGPVPPVGVAHELLRCARFLEILGECSPCYQSDLKILDNMVAGFLQGRVSPSTPHCEPCWAGYEEWAYPVVIHGHVVGAVMVGQFDTTSSPQCFDDFDRSLLRWQQGRPAIAHHISLAPHRSAVEEAIRLDEQRQSPLGQERVDLERQIRDLLDLGCDRYRRQRDLSESAFRTELAGVATARFLNGDDLEAVLPHILNRMRVFWAFYGVALCVMDDSENLIRLNATTHRAFRHPGEVLATPPPSGLTSEYGASSILLGSVEGVDVGSEDPSWHALAAEIQAHFSTESEPWGNLNMFVVVRVGPRVYVFCFCGRNSEQMSDLPHPTDHLTRLSPEARGQITRTCDRLAVYIHHFWARDDQEQLFRILGHSLRSLIVTMKKGDGLLRHTLQIHREKVQHQFPQLFDDARQLLESLQMGSRAVHDELASLASVAKLERLREKAQEQKTDLVSLLTDLEPLCHWRSRVNALRVKGEFIDRPVKWEFEKPDEALVFGNQDVIALAIRNVLDNAFKYSYSGRTISVKMLREGQSVILSVANQGVPVRTDEKKRVFQRDYRGYYVRRREVRGEIGTGYGLFIVNAIMKALNGDVTLESEMLQGSERPEGRTTVTLTFTAVE